MSFLDLASERYSVRSFSSKKVEQEKIDLILKSAQIAPTACNNQPQVIIQVNSEESLKKLKKCKTSDFNEQLAFIICYDKNKCWTRDYDEQKSGEVDASIITTFMMLEAWDLGIGSTWVMHFIPEAVKEEFDLEDNIIPVAILCMGYPSESAKPSRLHFKTKEIDEMVKID